MSVLISVFDLKKSFGAQNLFQKLTFTIYESQKIGLIGPNGAGKSTLLKILARKETQDEGQVSFSKGLRIGYLDQDPQFPKDETVFSLLMKGLADPDDPMEQCFVYELISRLELDSDQAGIETPVQKLSGGWLKRLALAQALVQKPQLLLFDEPTNHLDVKSIEWLEDFLNSQVGIAHLMITHDRLFLQNTCDFIFDLDPRNPRGLIQQEGTYADFVALKQAELDAQKNLELVKTNQLRHETAWLRRGAKARQTKQKARIERAHELADTVDHLANKNRDRKISFDLTSDIRNPKKIIEAEKISVVRGGRTLIRDFSFILGARARVGIVGANGAGKTSLIETLLGKEAPASGSIKINDQVSFAVFDQKKMRLDLEKSVLKNICAEGDYIHVRGQPVFAKSYLSRFHFRHDQMDLPVSKLSGGERTRLLLAGLLCQNEPVLILDEPTNDLDIATMDTLQESLADFPGALVLVTHDRYFLDQVCDEILVITDEGTIEKFANLFQYEDWKKSRSGKKERGSKASAPAPQAEAPPASSSAKKLGFKEQRELYGMEQTIHQEEAQIQKFEVELGSPEVIANYVKLQEVTKALEDQRKKVDSLYARWEELSKKTT